MPPIYPKMMAMIQTVPDFRVIKWLLMVFSRHFIFYIKTPNAPNIYIFYKNKTEHVQTSKLRAKTDKTDKLKNI